MKRSLFYALAMALLSTGVVSLNAAAQQAVTPTSFKLVAGAKAGNCAGCHHGAKVLPDGHVNTATMALSECTQCHTGGQGNAPTLETRIPLWHIHALSKVTCIQCHTAGTTQPATRQACVQCHDPEAVAQKTAFMNARNPHNNRHFGTKENCNDCHHIHKASENHCTDCHNFKLMVP